MKKIAILKVYDTYDSSIDMTKLVTQGISEWTETSEEDFKILKDYVNKNQYQKDGSLLFLVERVDANEDYVQATVPELLRLSRLEQEKKLKDISGFDQLK